MDGSTTGEEANRHAKSRGNATVSGKLGDFTTTPRVIFISLLAIGIGIVSGFIALLLLKLIGIFTNLFFFQHLYPILNATKQLVGVVTRRNLQTLAQEQHIENKDLQLDNVLHQQPVVAYPDEPLRSVVYRMADTGFTRFPVVERDNPQHLVGIVSLQDLLKARSRNLDEERRRERILHLHLFFPGRGREPETTTTKEDIDRDLIKERE